MHAAKTEQSGPGQSSKFDPKALARFCIKGASRDLREVGGSMTVNLRRTGNGHTKWGCCAYGGCDRVVRGAFGVSEVLGSWRNGMV